MRVAVVHYHYRPGGVTRVVENAFESLQGRGITAIAISGEPYEGSRLPVRIQPGLRYSKPNEKLFPGPLWYSLKMIARRALGGEPDLWHFHNPALGKNSAMAEVVCKMAAESPVLLQFHDFAEDGRPANYAMLKGMMESIDRLYPQAAQVHYATTNSRDRGFMCQSGFDAGNVHLLPNPVLLPQSDRPSGAVAGAGMEAQTGAEMANEAAANPALTTLFERAGMAADSPLYLYPTRAIRRKNLGEFLLWAALAAPEQNALYATSLAPENPEALAVYERWVAFARQLGLPVAFAAGQGRGAPDFAALMARARAIVTTSVAEGFGMAFLEPCLFGKPVLGRNLPDITGDFTAQGVDLGHLYDRLLVPDSLIDIAHLRQRLQSAMERTYAAYGRPLPADAVSRALESMGDGQGRIDFGRLDEPLQEQVIAQVAASPQLRSELLPASLFPASAGSAAEGDSIRRSREAVQAHYGSEAYGQKLAALYRQVADSRREPLRYAQPELLLDKFLAPERFSLLRAAGGTGR